MSEKIVLHKYKVFSKIFRLVKKPDINELIGIIERSHKIAENFAYSLFRGKLLAPPLETTLELNALMLKVILEINLVVSPFSQEVPNIDIHIHEVQKYFFNELEKELRVRGYVS